MKSFEKILADEKALLSLASQFAKNSVPGMVFYLQGSLGVGKTVFAKGFISALGFDGLVKSPTYSLVEPYTINNHLMCYHFDLYRLTDPEELEFTGSRDYFNAHAICLIEWPEKAAGHIPDADIVCNIEYLGNGRKITFSAYSEKGKEIMLQHLPN